MWILHLKILSIGESSVKWIHFERILMERTQPEFTCSNPTIETPGKCVKFAQS